MKECDILKGVKTYSDLFYIFSGGQDPHPQPPGSMPTFWSFVFGHINFKPSGAAKALIGGHCLIGADQT